MNNLLVSIDFLGDRFPIKYLSCFRRFCDLPLQVHYLTSPLLPPSITFWKKLCDKLCWLNLGSF